MQTVELTNVGPIERLSIPVPESGGVVVLKGANGLGKSHAIAGVQAMADPTVRKQLRNRDGSKEGSIEGLGVRVRLGRANTARGELSVSGLDSVMDPSAFVDPGLKDADAADARRVQVLARLAGIKVSRDEWASLFDGTVADPLALGISAEDFDGEDPVETSGKLRRKLHDRARAIEREIDGIQARADVAAKDLPADLPEELTLSDFHKAVARAEADLTVVKRQSDDDRRHQERRADAEKRLAAIVVGDAEALTAKAEVATSIAESNLKLADELAVQIEALRQQREQMLATVRQSRLDSERYIEEAKAAIEQARQVDELKAVIAKADRTPISPEQIAEAEAQVRAAQEALQQAVRTVDAIDRRNKWREHVGQISEKRKVADKLREVARSTDSVIEQALAARGFSDILISEGRLCVQTDRGTEAVSELSHGERWRLALDIASRGAEAGALLAVAQEAWESLDPSNRQFVADLAKERRIVLLTAEAAAGELRAEAFGGEA